MLPFSGRMAAWSLGLLAFHATLAVADEEKAFLRMLPRIETRASASASAAMEAKEAKRLRVLIAVDTDDPGGMTWGRDGANVKAMLEAGFQKQNIADRVAIDVFVGKHVTPEKILDYYRTLKVEPGDALLFYYSGHGGSHLRRGHFLQLTHGKLFRQDLIAAMDVGKPKLRVLLTDCCADFVPGAGAIHAEPTNAVVQDSGRDDTGRKPAALRQEPKFQERQLKADPRRSNKLPRPDLSPGTFPRAKAQEPPNKVADVVRGEPRNRAIAKREEPPIADGVPTKVKYAGLPTLTTHMGKVPMRDVIDASDGEVLRHLFLRHDGLVDVNGCAKGAFSFGEISWGGSLFTNSLIVLQKSKVADFDKNANRLVEWTEFFPELQRTTNQVTGNVFRNRQKQVPEAGRLGTPVEP